MTKNEALKMAIEALEQYIGVVQHKVNAETWGDIEDGGKPAIKAIQACKEALEQPAQEPIYIIGEGWKCDKFPEEGTKLYTQPAPSWQGLSDDEIAKIIGKGAFYEWNDVEFARAIEQALKDKNL